MASKTFIQLQIADPCHEAWEDMTPQSRLERHCQSCQRSVVDFSGMTDAQVVSYFKTLTQPVCGKFQGHQLGRTMEEARLARPNHYSGIAIAAALSILSPAVAAQQVSTDVPPPPPPSLAGYYGPSLAEAPQSRLIKGTIRDEVTDKPLIGANVVKNNSQGTCTDIDGRFQLRVPDDLKELKISYMGYETQVVKLDGQADYDILLMPQAYHLETVQVTGYRLSMKREIMGLLTLAVKEAPANARIDSTDLYLQALQVYPNPSSASTLPRVAIQTEKDASLRLHIANAAGQVLWDTKWAIGAGGNTLDLPDTWAVWPSGTYYIVVEDEQGQKITKPLVKQ